MRCSGRRRKCGCVGVVGVGWGGGGLALERSGGARLWWCDRGRGLCVGERTRGRTMEVQREGGGVLVMLVVVVMGSHDPNVTTCHQMSRHVTTRSRHVAPCHQMSRHVTTASSPAAPRAEVGPPASDGLWASAAGGAKPGRQWRLLGKVWDRAGGPCRVFRPFLAFRRQFARLALWRGIP